MKELKVLEDTDKIIVKDLLKNKNGYTVIFINGTIINVSEDTVLKYRLVKGKEVDKDILNNLSSDESYFSCYNQALKYIGSSLKATSQVCDNLVKHGYSNDDINLTIEKLKENKIIDDKLYASEYVLYLSRQGYGIKMIEYKAANLKLDIEEAIKNMDYDIYYEALDKLIKRQLKLYKDNKLNRLKKYLLNRGYLMSEILDSLRGENIEG
ncbi:MAG: regulatory protein RecX [Anaeroplasmataceae bacterium]